MTVYFLVERGGDADDFFRARKGGSGGGSLADSGKPRTKRNKSDSRQNNDEMCRQVHFLSLSLRR